MLEPLAPRELVRQLSRALADHGRGRIEQDPDLHQLIGSSAIREREKRRARAHRRQAGEQRSDRLLLLRQSPPVIDHIRCGQTKLRVGSADSRFRDFDCLGRGLPLRAQPARLIASLRSRLCELCDLRFSRSLLGTGISNVVVEERWGPLRGCARRSQHRNSELNPNAATHCPTLHDDKGDSRGSKSRGTIVRQAWRARASEARSRSRMPAGGPRPAVVLPHGRRAHQ